MIGTRAGLLLLTVLTLSACPSLQKSSMGSGITNNENGVVIQAPVGPPGPMADLLAQSIADALIRRGYVARADNRTAPGDPGAVFHVSGTAEKLEAIHAPTVAALHWVLRDGTGREVAYLTQGVRGNPDSWQYGSPAMIKIVGEEAAADFSVFLGRPPNPPVTAAAEPTVQKAPESEVIKELTQGSVPQSAAGTETTEQLPAPPSPPPLPPTGGVRNKRDFGLWLDEVTGAPGDGNPALTQAIFEELNRKKLPFAMTPGLASHYIQGVVDVNVRSAVAEHVTIVWVVSNAAGEEIGRVTQRNDIVRGSLHGQWGDTAIYAARGGLDGVLAILERDLETSLAQ